MAPLAPARGRWITRLADWQALAPAWDAAVAALPPPQGDNPFLQTDFLLPWCQQFVPAEALRVFVLDDGRGGIAGGLALFLKARRAWPHLPVLHAVGVDFANLTEPFSAAAQPAATFAAALATGLAALPGWRFLRLPWVRGSALPLLALPGLRTARAIAGRLASIECDTGAAAYMAAKSRNFRHTLRRHQQYAAAAGPVRLVAYTAVDDVAVWAQRHLEFNRGLRYRRGDHSGYPQPAWEAFTVTVARRLAARGRLMCRVLEIGGEAAAIGFGFRTAADAPPGDYHSVLLSYNPRWQRASPGFLYHYHLLDELAGVTGHARFQMFAGDETYKQRWANRFEPVYDVRAAARGPMDRLALAIWAARNPILKT